MNLHEYQSKQLSPNMPFPCRKARWPARRMKPVTAARKLGGSLWVVKAQVHAGGRGKAGGVKVTKDAESVRAAASGMLGTVLVTHQTGPRGCR